MGIKVGEKKILDELGMDLHSFICLVGLGMMLLILWINVSLALQVVDLDLHVAFCVYN